MDRVRAAEARDLSIEQIHVIFVWLHPTFQTQFVPQNVFERLASSEIPFLIEIFQIFAMNKDTLRTELES